jgi:transcriptional regulator GlxA family with amidase domain
MCAFRSRARMNAALTASSSASLTKAPVVKNGSTNGTLPQAVESLPAVREERLQKILEVIASGRPCTIQALAQEFNLSHSHLQHLFKQRTGARLGHLLTEQRLRHAAYLLTNTNLRIKEIAHSAGYEHTSSFIRAFERHFSQAPRLYRQNPEKAAKSPEPAGAANKKRLQLAFQRNGRTRAQVSSAT